MTTISELLINAMRGGGGEASTLTWRSVLSTLKESVAYAAREDKDESIGGTASPQNEKASSCMPPGGEHKTDTETDLFLFTEQTAT